MSDRPMSRFGGDAPDADQVGERHVVLRTLVKVRALIVLVPLVAVVLIAASIGAVKLWADIPPSSAEPDVTCWNDSIAPASECPAPSGRYGLRWVFPSFRPDEGACTEIERRARDTGRPVEFACEERFDQRAVTIVYSVRTELSQGLSFLQRTYAVTPVEDAQGAHLVFRADQPDAEGQYRVTVAYAAYPYTVTVEAPAPGLRDAALRELVKFRAVDAIVVKSETVSSS